MVAFRVPKSIEEHNLSYSKYEEIPEEVFARLRERYAKIQTDKPLVSVVVIAYNEEQNVLKSISSLSKQNTNLPYEVIVVNNNSKDHTAEIIERSGACLVNEMRQGHGWARQGGLEAARGTYHLCGDADTIYPPTYVQSFYDLLQPEDVAGAFGTYSFLPPEGQKRFSYGLYETFRDPAVKARALKRPELAVGGACFAFMTQPGLEIGWRTDVQRGEDGSMLLALKKYGKVVFDQGSGVRAWTSARTLVADGNLFQMVWKRVRREFKRIGEYFTSNDQGYDMTDKNLRK
jgi:glycosyltransferase involved in cell wall biosynthesis